MAYWRICIEKKVKNRRKILYILSAQILCFVISRKKTEKCGKFKKRKKVEHCKVWIPTLLDVEPENKQTVSAIQCWPWVSIACFTCDTDYQKSKYRKIVQQTRQNKKYPRFPSNIQTEISQNIFWKNKSPQQYTSVNIKNNLITNQTHTHASQV